MIESVIIYIIIDWLCIRITQFDHHRNSLSLISLEVIISSFLLIIKSFAVASGRNFHKAFESKLLSVLYHFQECHGTVFEEKKLLNKVIFFCSLHTKSIPVTS